MTRSSGAAVRRPRVGGRSCARARADGGRSPGRGSTRASIREVARRRPTVSMPRSWSFVAVLMPTPHSRSTGRGCRNASSCSGGTTSRPSGLATRLATFARNLVRATPTVIGRPTRSSTRAAEADGDLRRGAREPSEAADVEEGLVDRDAFDEWRRVVEHLEHGLAGFGVRVHAGRDDDRVRAQNARLPSAHRREHTERLCLVAGREHDARRPR